ncbi:MAG TPA: hypothetical protein PLP17_12935 [Oligoflexia bacterium]|nr:hypothetical protein [Oligoflexia bacterium]
MSFKEHSAQNLVIGAATIACFVLVLYLSSAAGLRQSSSAEFIFGLLFGGMVLFFIVRGGFWWVPPWALRSRWISPQEYPIAFWVYMALASSISVTLLVLGLLRLKDPSIPGLFALFDLLTEWKKR